jgi:lipopolysaccharide/colanic/teichoic acid biosynthesis glycosyltransferase/dTDP-glucose pyrophosphorylase
MANSMKAVILAGSPGTALFPLVNLYPKLMFPIANEPLIIHLLNFLKKSNISEVAIISAVHSGGDYSLMNIRENCRVQGIHASFFEEKRPRGTAGCLKELKGFIGSSHFLVVTSNVFTGYLDLSEVLSIHQTQRAAVTVLVEKRNDGRNNLENIQVGKDGLVKKFHILHHSKDNRRVLLPTGLYIFNPCVLDYIPERGHMDIKEQLIPFLDEKRLPVYGHEINGFIKKIDNVSDYFQLNKEVLLNDFMRNNGDFHCKTEIMDRVWVGDNVKISPKAYILGPVVIGDDCTLEDYSQVIGPTSIGGGSCIGMDVLVRESIIWEKTDLKRKSHIEYSLIADTCVIPNGETVRNSVVVQGKWYDRSFNFMSLFDKDAGKPIINENGLLTTVSYKILRNKIFLATKRLLDVVLSSFGLILSLPMSIIIATAIKIDSPGPVFFCQRRCGKGGKEFKMYKFRTMIKGAEKIHKYLIEKKDIDGPMFKMMSDPRLTRVGRFLRQTSLDEFPQLFNVLRGEMSLVGPRPLAMEEMKFSPSWRDIRLKVKPGITGQLQVSGRSAANFAGWIRHDIYYVRNQSLWLDIKLLIKTIWVVIKRVGSH